jgi:hypothetical protein
MQTPRDKSVKPFGIVCGGWPVGSQAMRQRRKRDTCFRYLPLYINNAISVEASTL